MVLSAAHCLDALTVLGAALIYIMGDIGGADKTDGHDIFMIEDRIHHLLVAMDDLQDTVRKPGFLHQLGKPHWDAGIAFRGFQDECIAAGNRHAEHPHRDHCREVERRDTGANAERLAHRIDIDTRARALSIFALQDMRNTAAKLDDFQPALHIALCIGDDLAMF